MGEEDKEKLGLTLYEDSIEIISNFHHLSSATLKSFQHSQISSKDIAFTLTVQKAAEDVNEDLECLQLRKLLPGLRNIEDMEHVMWEISSYCSYFNFHMLERIIDRLGAEKDKANLTRYKEGLCKYGERDLSRCPSRVGTMKEEGFANMFVTLDEVHSNCTLNQLQGLSTKLQTIFNISNVELRLCYIFPDSINLMFQIPLSIQSAIFPLSSEQQEALVNLGFSQLSCGDYQVDKNGDQVN